MTNKSILLLIHVDHLCMVFCFIFFLVTNDSINVKLCTFCTFRMAVKILLHLVQVVCKFGITIVYDFFFLLLEVSSSWSVVQVRFNGQSSFCRQIYWTVTIDSMPLFDTDKDSCVVLYPNAQSYAYALHHLFDLMCNSTELYFLVVFLWPGQRNYVFFLSSQKSYVQFIIMTIEKYHTSPIFSCKD